MVLTGLTAGGGGGGCFLWRIGRNTVGVGVAGWFGTCFDAARAYEGALGVEVGLEKLNLPVGIATAAFITARCSANWLSLEEMVSGTLHPKVLAHARFCLT